MGKTQIEVTFAVDEHGVGRANWRLAEGSARGRLLAGRYMCTLEVDARPVSIGELAEEEWKVTGSFDKVAARVVEHHELAKAGRL